MYRLFREKDCSLVEINPLAVTAQGRLVAADAKIVFDDNGLFRHPELAGLRNPEEYTADELEAKEAGLSFVSLAGEIGCMVNGAGLAMATMDGIKLAGGSPANFLDVGGSSNPQKVLDAMRILLRNQGLKAILVNIFGGITRCDDIAQGILMAREKLQIARADGHSAHRDQRGTGPGHARKGGHDRRPADDRRDPGRGRAAPRRGCV